MQGEYACGAGCLISGRLDFRRGANVSGHRRSRCFRVLGGCLCEEVRDESQSILVSLGRVWEYVHSIATTRRDWSRVGILGRGQYTILLLCQSLCRCLPSLFKAVYRVSRRIRRSRLRRTTQRVFDGASFLWPCFV